MSPQDALNNIIQAIDAVSCNGPTRRALDASIQTLQEAINKPKE